MSDFQQELTDRLFTQCDSRTRKQVQVLLDEGARWIGDPAGGRVYGLQPEGSREVAVILYLADPDAFVPRPWDDFEVSDDLALEGTR